jgi:hypothetical protein
MQYEVQAYIAAIWPSDQNMTDAVVKAAKAMEKALAGSGLGYIIEVRDVRGFKSVYKTVQACAPQKTED